MHESSRQRQDAEFVLMEGLVDLESHALFTQGSYDRGHVWNVEAQYGVFVRRKIGNSRNAHRGSVNIKNAGEIVFGGHYQTERVAIESRGTRAIPRADNNDRLRKFQNPHPPFPLLSTFFFCRSLF